MNNSQQNPQKMTLGHLLANVSRLVGGRMRMGCKNSAYTMPRE